MTTHRLSLLIITTTVILCWTAVINAHSSQTPRSGFDEPCNKTLKCKSQSWLTCDNKTGKCKCARSDDMVYDQTREKCVASIGERCKFGFDEEEESGNTAWFERADCVEGSVCGPSGICLCPEGFYEDSKLSQCSRVKDNGQPCLNKNECDEEKFLTCTQGKCDCDPDTSVYTLNSFPYYAVSNKNQYRNKFRSDLIPAGICVGRVGTNCSQYSVRSMKYCVQNAYCESDLSICRCMDTYGETSEKLCGQGYQQSCSDTNICSDKLLCSGASQKKDYSKYFEQQMKCQCSDPGFQIYDAIETSCRGLVGAPCDPKNKSSCTDKSSCTERDNAFQCECDVGFVDTDKGYCQLAFGSSCNYQNGGEVENMKVCDLIAGLRCKRGKCSCENDSQFYENNKRKCLTSVGLRCNATSEMSECVSNSECIKSEGSYWGRCACLDGFSVTKEHICATLIGEDVSSVNAMFDDNDGQNSTLISI